MTHIENVAGIFEYLTLTRLVGDPDSFLNRYWTQSPMLHRSNTDTEFSDILDSAAFDAILSAKLREPYVRASKDGRPLNAARFMSPARVEDIAVDGGVLSVDHLAREFSGGATIILDGIDHYHQAVTELCTSLSSELKASVEAVAFITPANAPGLDVHYDNVEVFVLQLAGRKRWTVYEQVRPLVNKSRVVSRDRISAPVLEAITGPGDCLYIPWGSPHSAVALESTSSHLSIMVRPRTWGEIVADLIRSTIRTGEREPVSANANELSASIDDEARSRVNTALSNLRSRDGKQFFGQYLLEQVRSTPLRAGFLEQAALRAAMSSDSRVRRDRRVDYVLKARDDGYVEVRIGAKTLRFPGEAYKTLTAIEVLDEANIRDLPSMLSESVLLKVVGYLVENGVLRLIDNTERMTADARTL